jgi:hypothetical protein
VVRDENATVLLFRDSALRRPIDVVAWMSTHAPREPEPRDARDNVIPLRLCGSSRPTSRLAGPPEDVA